MGLSQHDWCSYEKRRSGRRYAQTEDRVKTDSGDRDPQARGEASEEPSPAHTSTLDVQPQEL